jgi:hypothetical protein
MEFFDVDFIILNQIYGGYFNLKFGGLYIINYFYVWSHVIIFNAFFS